VDSGSFGLRFLWILIWILCIVQLTYQM